MIRRVESGFILVNDTLSKPEQKEQRGRRRRPKDQEKEEEHTPGSHQDGKVTVDVVA